MARLNFTRKRLRELGVSEGDIQAVMSKGVRLASDGADPLSASKYHNVQCIDEFFETAEAFDSVWERKVWYQRKAEELGGVLRNLRRQVSYRLVVNGLLICRYVADFVYDERVGEGQLEKWVEVVEDAKGQRLPVYAIKYKLMRALYGITVRETYEKDR